MALLRTVRGHVSCGPVVSDDDQLNPLGEAMPDYSNQSYEL